AGKALGAEVSGIDLREPPDDATIAALSSALVEHKVLVFRNQDISVEQHLAFGRRFGALEGHPFARKVTKHIANSDDHPELIILRTDEQGMQARADHWHSDVTWRINPSLGSILRARIVPEIGGDTLWANMCAVYEGLSSRMQSMLSGLTAIHDSHDFRK